MKSDIHNIPRAAQYFFNSNGKTSNLKYMFILKCCHCRKFVMFSVFWMIVSCKPFYLVSKIAYISAFRLIKTIKSFISANPPSFIAHQNLSLKMNFVIFRHVLWLTLVMLNVLCKMNVICDQSGYFDFGQKLPFWW